MKKIIGVIVIVVIAFVLFGRDKDQVAQNTDDVAMPIVELSNEAETEAEQIVIIDELPVEQTKEAEPNKEVNQVKEVKQVKEFTVTGTPFEFSMKEIRVAKGDTVRIVFKNEKGTHDWNIDEFNAATKVIKTGEQDIVEFVADKSGTFEYYCSVGNHRELGMVGNLIVE